MSIGKFVAKRKFFTILFLGIFLFSMFFIISPRLLSRLLSNEQVSIKMDAFSWIPGKGLVFYGVDAQALSFSFESDIMVSFGFGKISVTLNEPRLALFGDEPFDVRQLEFLKRVAAVDLTVIDGILELRKENLLVELTSQISWEYHDHSNIFVLDGSLLDSTIRHQDWKVNDVLLTFDSVVEFKDGQFALNDLTVSYGKFSLAELADITFDLSATSFNPKDVEANFVISIPIIPIAEDELTNIRLRGNWDGEMLVINGDGLANEGIQSANGWMNERGIDLHFSSPYLKAGVTGNFGYFKLNNALEFDLTGYINDGAFTTSGQWMLNDWYGEGMIKLQEFDLSLLPFAPGLLGTLNFEGSFSGKDPTLKGLVEIGDLNIDRYQFINVLGNIELDRSSLNIDWMEFVSHNSHYQVLGEISLRDTKLNLHAKLIQGYLQDIFPLVGLHINDNFDGEIDGYIYLGGTISDPQGRLLIDLLDGSVGDYSISGSLDLELVTQGVVINRLRLENDVGMLLAMGSVAEGEVDLFVETTKFPLEIVSTYLEIEPFYGTIDLTSQFAISPTTIKGNGRITVLGLKWRDYLVDQVDLTLDMEDGRSHLKPLHINAGVGELFIDGNLGPFTPTTFSEWKRINMDLNIDIPESTIGKIGTIDPSVLMVKGQLGEFDVLGNLAVRDIALELPLVGGIKDGSLRIDFFNDSANVVFEAPFSSGEIRVDGGVALFTQNVDLNVTVQEAQLVEGPISGSILGNLKVNGNIFTPLISGDLKLEKGRLSLASITSLSSLATLGALNGGGRLYQSFFDPNIDLSISSSNLEIGGFGVDVQTEGQIKLTGKTIKPKIQGGIQAVSGTINYFGTEFQLQDGRVEFSEWYRLPFIEVNGRAYADDLTIFLLVSGQADDLKFALSSDPYLPENEIFSSLNWPRTLQRVGNQGLSYDEILRLMSGQAGLLLSGIEKAIQKSLALDLVKIQPDLVKGELGITLGKNLFKNLYLGYERRFLGSTRESIEFRYQVSPNFSMSSVLDANEGNKYLIELNSSF